MDVPGSSRPPELAPALNEDCWNLILDVVGKNSVRDLLRLARLNGYSSYLVNQHLFFNRLAKHANLSLHQPNTPSMTPPLPSVSTTDDTTTLTNNTPTSPVSTPRAPPSPWKSTVLANQGSFCEICGIHFNNVIRRREYPQKYTCYECEAEVKRIADDDALAARRRLVRKEYSDLQGVERVEQWIKFGRGNIKTIARVIRTIPDRRVKIKDALKREGISMPRGSKLVSEYVTYAKGDLGVIVRILREYEWFSKNTTYKKDCQLFLRQCDDKIRGDGGAECLEDNTRAKTLALHRWVRENVVDAGLGFWEGVAEITPRACRPPGCLWPKIMKEVRVQLDRVISSRYRKVVMQRALIGPAAHEEPIEVKPDRWKIEEKDPFDHSSDEVNLHDFDPSDPAILATLTPSTLDTPPTFPHHPPQTPHTPLQTLWRHAKLTALTNDILPRVHHVVLRRLAEPREGEEIFARRRDVMAWIRTQFDEEFVDAVARGLWRSETLFGAVKKGWAAYRELVREEEKRWRAEAEKRERRRRR
ncbi:hypothetical protein HDV00_002853 [Rhizophlyctis rosea]|nr:hypothetical protein HDV00_002853 [Rhizophlyctis rosea]